MVKGNILCDCVQNKTELELVVKSLKEKIYDQGQIILELEKKLKKSSSGLICSCCMDYFCIPYMLQCGHSFCFSCLESWTVSQEDSIISGLIDEMSCPNCRTIISQIPVMNRALRQVLEQSTNCQEEGILPMEDVDSYSVRLSRETEHFKKITLNGSITPWDDIFLKPLIDPDDGVHRCPECMWEIEDNRCSQCNREFRSIVTNEFDDEVDMESNENSDNEPDEYLGTDEEDVTLSPHFYDTAEETITDDKIGDYDSDLSDKNAFAYESSSENSVSKSDSSKLKNSKSKCRYIDESASEDEDEGSDMASQTEDSDGFLIPKHSKYTSEGFSDKYMDSVDKDLSEVNSEASVDDLIISNTKKLKQKRSRYNTYDSDNDEPQEILQSKAIFQQKKRSRLVVQDSEDENESNTVHSKDHRKSHIQSNRSDDGVRVEEESKLKGTEHFNDTAAVNQNCPVAEFSHEVDISLNFDCSYSGTEYKIIKNSAIEPSLDIKDEAEDEMLTESCTTIHSMCQSNIQKSESGLIDDTNSSNISNVDNLSLKSNVQECFKQLANVDEESKKLSEALVPSFSINEDTEVPLSCSSEISPKLSKRARKNRRKAERKFLLKNVNSDTDSNFQNNSTDGGVDTSNSKRAEQPGISGDFPSDFDSIKSSATLKNKVNTELTNIIVPLEFSEPVSDPLLSKTNVNPSVPVKPPSPFHINPVQKFKDSCSKSDSYSSQDGDSENDSRIEMNGMTIFLVKGESSNGTTSDQTDVKESRKKSKKKKQFFMIERIELPFADDMHVHLRSGPLMSAVTRTIREGGVSTVLVMPNLTPPISNTEMAVEYKKKLMEIDDSIQYLMTLYLSNTLTPQEIRNARNAGVVAVKSYPKGVTTNSDNGIEDYKMYYDIFKTMEEVGMVLCLHGEVPSDPHNDICVMNAEEKFLVHLIQLHKDFPNLKIVLEHATTAKAIEVVKSLGNTVGCTITAHHLFLTVDDWAGRPHNFCKPVAKFPHDRKALRDIIKEGHPRFFLGSDSAPHPKEKKECSHVCAGVFTSSHLLPYLATVLESFDSLSSLIPFACSNGRNFYGASLLQINSISIVKSEINGTTLKYVEENKTSRKHIVMERKKNIVPNSLTVFDRIDGVKEGNVLCQVVPFLAGEELNWVISKQ